MNAAPVVTVIIPTYNCASHLAQAIESVLAQTFDDFELLVIDDGSTDGTEAVAGRYLDDARVRYVRHACNTGPSAARNRGIRLSSGNLLAFLDADDYWAPGKLEAQVAALSEHEVDVCGVGCCWLMPGGKRVFVAKQQPHSGDGLYRELLFKNTIPGSSSALMLRRRCFEEVGLFDEELRISEDRDMWLRMAERYRFTFLGAPLVYINRRRADSAITDHRKVALGREAFLQKREHDMPARFRALLPQVRRTSYLSIARKYRAAGDTRNSRRYCVRAISSSIRVDAALWRSLRVMGSSFLPVSVRYR